MIRLLSLALLQFLAASVSAHTLAPALLKIQTIDAQLYAVHWRSDVRTALAPPEWPSLCAVENETLARDGTALDRHFELRCKEGLAGETLRLEGLGRAKTTVLFRYQDLQQRELQRMLTADRPVITLPAEVTAASIWSEYLGLGIQHILGGLDHLLLILGLFLLAHGWRDILWNVTAFTLGHSLTLALASLELLVLPDAPVEIAIAATLLWLALDLARQKPAAPRHALLFVSFGLVHGLGFAGALGELGLPAGDRLIALLSFNLGIEIGQLGFLLVCAISLAVLARLHSQIARQTQAALTYAIGSIAAFLLIERGLPFLI